MIQGIQGYHNSVSNKNKTTTNVAKVAPNSNLANGTTPIQTTQSNLAIRQNAIAHINFGNATQSGALVEDFQMCIPNLFATKRPFIVEPTGAGNQNAPLAVDCFYNPATKKREYSLYSDTLKQPVMKMTRTTNAELVPEVRVKTGKFAPMAEIIDREIGIKIQVLPGSSVKTHGTFSVINPGKFRTGSDEKSVAFQGRGESQVVVYNKEDKVYKATETYRKSGLANEVERGDYIDIIQEDNPTFMVLAGGYGTRLYDYTDCKPAAKLPTDPNYTLMCNALDQMAKSGYLDNESSLTSNFTYLTGKGTLSGNNIKPNIQETNLGDGGCIAKSLANGNTSTDTPLIILNADTITNADITRAYEAYKRNPDAAILIPYYEAPESRAKDFGLMEAKGIGNGTLEIKSFVEKPKTLEEAKPAKVKGNDKYMANPGIYIIGPQALKQLKEKGKDLLKNPKEVGLAKDFITPLVKACIDGKFTNEDGSPMKCYTALLEKKGGGSAFWDDLGKDYTIPETFRFIAKETVEHGAESPENLFYGLPAFMLNDAVKNVDLHTGVTFMNSAAREKLDKFNEKYGTTFLYGNCIVYDSIN